MKIRGLTLLAGAILGLAVGLVAGWVVRGRRADSQLAGLAVITTACQAGIDAEVLRLLDEGSRSRAREVLTQRVDQSVSSCLRWSASNPSFHGLAPVAVPNALVSLRDAETWAARHGHEAVARRASSVRERLTGR